MLIELEARPEPSRLMAWLSPVLAAAVTLAAGFALFSLLGKDPIAAFLAFFVEPVATRYGVGELLLKASPLMLCALGLAIGYRANVWNIGAEGQLTVGAICGGGLALWLPQLSGAVLLPLMIAAGMVGGLAWAAIPAWLRTRYNANEILTSLMLVYIATLALSYLVQGPWRDPEGFNFPQSSLFGGNALLPVLLAGTRLNVGFLLAIAVVAIGWVFTARTLTGFRMRVAGLAPRVASYAGISAPSTVWIGMLVGGAIGQLLPSISPGYGFAAIIVAFVGRLHPLGIALASLLMSLLYLGGEAAQIGLDLPSAITRLFQGMLLFFLLAADVFIGHRLRFRRVRSPGTASKAAQGAAG